MADLTTGEIFNSKLLPIASWQHKEIMEYLDRRVYAQSNKIARRIDQRQSDRTSFKLGLSDSYWVSFSHDEKFEDVSPYYRDFGTLSFVKGLVEPTLRLGGSFDKEWQRLGSVTFIRKIQNKASAKVEILAGFLASLLEVGDIIPPVQGGDEDWDGVVFIKNLSSPEKMLLDFGSVLAPKFLSDGYIIQNVQDMYSMVGFGLVTDYILRVILFDSIIGNEDRRNNQGNWGFFKSAIDGSVSLCPAYDFNMAYSLDLDPMLMRARVDGIVGANLVNQAVGQLDEWENTVMQFCKKYDYEVWCSNLKRMVGMLMGES